MAVRTLPRLRRLCLALPDVQEGLVWGEPTFRVRDKMFATYANPNNHHGAGRPAVWVKASPGRQVRMVGAAPDRFFVPPYVGSTGWLGIWLDGRCNWKELDDILRAAYCLAAPKMLVRAVRYGTPIPPGAAPNRGGPQQ